MNAGTRLHHLQPWYTVHKYAWAKFAGVVMNKWIGIAAVYAYCGVNRRLMSSLLVATAVALNPLTATRMSWNALLSQALAYL